jgi:hypothetical protein
VMPSQTGGEVSSRPVDCSPVSVFTAHILAPRRPSRACFSSMVSSETHASLDHSAGGFLQSPSFLTGEFQIGRSAQNVGRHSHCVQCSGVPESAGVSLGRRTHSRAIWGHQVESNFRHWHRWFVQKPPCSHPTGQASCLHGAW